MVAVNRSNIFRDNLVSTFQTLDKAYKRGIPTRAATAKRQDAYTNIEKHFSNYIAKCGNDFSGGYFGSIHRTEDMVQECRVKLYLALLDWTPAKGHFAPFFKVVLKNHLVDLVDEENGIIHTPGKKFVEGGHIRIPVQSTDVLRRTGDDGATLESDIELYSVTLDYDSLQASANGMEQDRILATVADKITVEMALCVLTEVERYVFVRHHAYQKTYMDIKIEIELAGGKRYSKEGICKILKRAERKVSAEAERLHLRAA